MRWLLSLFGVCKHDKLTFPQSDRATGLISVSCLRCGAGFAYDWCNMTVGAKRER